MSAFMETIAKCSELIGEGEYIKRGRNGRSHSLSRSHEGRPLLRRRRGGRLRSAAAGQGGLG